MILILTMRLLDYCEINLNREHGEIKPAFPRSVNFQKRRI